MASELLTPDEWTILISDRLRFFLGTNPLDEPGYRPAIEYGIDAQEQLIEVRTRAPMLAGWRCQFRYGGLALPPGVGDDLEPVDTGQFRASVVDRARRIHPDQIRRARGDLS